MSDTDAMRATLTRFIVDELLRRPDLVLAGDLRLISGGYLDSLAVARLGVFIEEAFDVFIPDSELTVEKIDTLDQIVERVAAWRGRRR